MDSKEIDRAMKHRLPVVCNGIRYDRISEYISWYDDKGQRRLSVVLMNAGNRSTVRVPADRVELEQSKGGSSC